MVMIIPLLVFIAVTGLFSVGSLTVSHFNALYSLSMGIIATIIYIYKTGYIQKLRSIKIPKLETLFFILILVLALILRLPPSQYIMGGQDQGTYVNIAHQYVKQGSLKYKDYFRETLSEAQKEIYDKNMSNLMPSFEYYDRDASILEMVFYPMHPSWIAIFEVIFGQNNSTYSLTFFSTISLVAIYLITYELVGKKKTAGLIAMGLAAINPMHVFYSKFPVGEITALTYIAMGFYLLIRVLNAEKITKQNIFELFLSILLFNGFYYTRMSSFMYLPIFALIGVLSVLYIKNKVKKKAILIYLGSLTVTFFVSFVFYFKFLPITFNRIYPTTMQKLLGSASDIKLLAIVAVTAAVILLINRFNGQKILKKTKELFEKYIWVIFVILILIIAYFSIKQYQSINLKDISVATNTERYWYTGVNRVEALKHTNLFVLSQHISLIGLIALFTGTVLYGFKKEKDAKIVTLLITTLYFLLIQVTFGDIVRYQYYTARYIFLEIVNFTIIILAIFSYLSLGSKLRYITYSALSLITIYFLIFSFVQTLGTEGQSIKFYDDVRNVVKTNDLLILFREQTNEKPQKYFNNFATFSVAPFKYYYDMNVFSVENVDNLFGEDIKLLSKNYKNTYVLSNEKIQSLSEVDVYKQKYSYYNVSDECTFHTYSFLKLASVKGMDINGEIGCLLPPHKYYTREMMFYLYKLR